LQQISEPGLHDKVDAVTRF